MVGGYTTNTNGAMCMTAKDTYTLKSYWWEQTVIWSYWHCSKKNRLDSFSRLSDSRGESKTFHIHFIYLNLDYWSNIDHFQLVGRMFELYMTLTTAFLSETLQTAWAEVGIDIHVLYDVFKLPSCEFSITLGTWALPFLYWGLRNRCFTEITEELIFVWVKESENVETYICFIDWILSRRFCTNRRTFWIMSSFSESISIVGWMISENILFYILNLVIS